MCRKITLRQNIKATLLKNNSFLVKNLCCGWYQVISGISCVVLGGFGWLVGGFRWDHVVPAGFRSFKAIPHFGKYEKSQHCHRSDALIFV